MYPLRLAPKSGEKKMWRKIWRTRKRLNGDQTIIETI